MNANSGKKNSTSLALLGQWMPVSTMQEVELPSELLAFAEWQREALRERPADALPVYVAAERLPCLVCDVRIESGDAYVSIDEDPDGTWHAGHLACVVCPNCRRFNLAEGGVMHDENGKLVGCMHLPQLPEGFAYGEVEDEE